VRSEKAPGPHNPVDSGSVNDSSRRPVVVPRTVKGLGFVSLFNDFASEMVYPLLPAFVTGMLGGGPLALGALDGAADLTAATLKWVSGRLSDRPGWQKPLILVGYGTAVLVRPLIAVANAAWQVIGFRVLDRVGKGLRSPARDALVAQVTPPASRGRAFGFHRAMDHIGAVAGSLVAWVVLQRGVDVRTVISWSVAPGVVAVAVLAWVLRAVSGPPDEGTAGRREEGSETRPEPGDAAGAAFWGPVVLLVLLTVGRLPEMLLLLRLQDLGVAVAAVPLVWAVLHVVRSVASYPGGWLSDRLGPRGTLVIGGLVFAGVSAWLARDLSPGWAAGVFLLLGLVTGLTEAAERALIAVLAPVRTGRGFGSAQALAGVAALPAGLGFGLLYQRAGAPAALLLSGSVVALSALLFASGGARSPAAAGR
jgi:MFS family permease